VLQEAVRKFRCAPIVGLLIAVVPLATAFGSPAAPASPEPAATPTAPSVSLRTRPTEETAPTGHVQADDVLHPPHARSSGIEFEHISIEQGLSQSSVNCILQDSRGFMWFGTDDGLNKYDGYHFTIYSSDPEDAHSLSHNEVTSIVEDQWGALWIGTRDGLNRFDRETEQFTRYQADAENPHSLSDNAVLALFEDRSGVLWIGTWSGLDRFDRETEQFVHYGTDPREPYSWDDSGAMSIYEDRSGALWIGTWSGLDRWDQERGRFTHYRPASRNVTDLGHNAVQSVVEDSAGRLWVGTAGSGFYQFDRETERFTQYLIDPGDVEGFTYNDVMSIHEDQTGVLWIGTDGGGLYQFDRDTGQLIPHQMDPRNANSLSSNYIRSIYESQTGVLWVGTWGGGVNKFDRNKEKFIHYQTDPNDPNSLSHCHVLALCEDREGMLWIGTDGGGLDRFDRETQVFTHYRHDADDAHSLSNNYVRAIYQDREGVLWVGTWGGGLNRFDRENERFIHYRADADDPNSLSSDIVLKIYQDREGVLWIATSGGLNEFDRETGQFTHCQTCPSELRSFGNNTVWSFFEDPAGVLWLGTSGGLGKFDREKGQFVHYKNDPEDPGSLSSDIVTSIHQDRTGALWIGTWGGGLSKFDRDRETFTHHREQDGLPNDVVSGILEDDKGNLWLSTHRGLSSFNPETETFRNYEVSDGLQGYEFTGACYRSRSGEMFFGGINGFNAFFADRVRDNPYIPSIVLTSLTQDGEDVDVGVALESVREVTFKWPNNSFEFEFAALNHSQTERNQYAYMLETFDDEWRYIGTRRFGRYTNLPSGTYTLRLKGSNSDGVWNEEGVSVKVTVLPPFWEAWWFRGLVVLVLAGSAIGGYRLRVKSIQARSRELETQVRERTYEIERRRQELEALYRADAELYRHLRLDQVLQALVDIAVDVLDADKSSLIVWDERRERLGVQASRGFSPETLAHMSFAPGDGTCVGHVAATGKPAIVQDTRVDPRVANCPFIVESEGIRSSIHVPIKIGGDLFGVFTVDYVQPHAFGDDEQRLYIALAQRAALPIQNAQLYEQAQELAVVEERSRLARDLHDAVTQMLFSASLIAEALPNIWENDPDEARELLAEMRRLSRGALAEMRTLLLELRPAALTEASLGDLLDQLAEAVSGRKDMAVTVTAEGECTLPPDVHVALYRIAQEALNNVAKHARASQVEISLRCIPPAPQACPLRAEGGVELRVSDDGRGFDLDCVPSDRLGLGIIRERAQAIGATLEIESEPGRGTQIRVKWKKDEG
jgi:signal transduction histidine kinase/ligand-binding sensor domain-containing protein